MVNNFLACMAITEAFALTLALFALFRQWGNTFAEAGAYAIVSAMMVFSFLFQSGFMPGLRYPALAAELLALVASLRYVLRQRGYLATDLKSSCIATFGEPKAKLGC
jgi:hypothetical protein